MSASSSSASSPRQSLHRLFVSALPRIVRHARAVFRFVRCWHSKQDKIQEVRSLCWKWVKLHKAGRAWWQYVSRLADFACRAVKSGRKVVSMISAKDALNEITQFKRGFYVGKLPDVATLSDNPLAEALIDNTRTEVPEQVCFRQDFPCWQTTLNERDRRILHDMAMGERTTFLAKKYHVSRSRISQLRRRFHESWEQFCDERA